MLIDTHCHIDQFPSPEDVVLECEKSALRVVAVTNLPSHFAVAADRLLGHPLVSAALGLHPLLSTEGLRELTAFRKFAPQADFIGEVGLDFSRNGIASKSIQERLFNEVIHVISDRPRFITLHSRGAERVVLDALLRHKVQNAVFHWFTGSDRDLHGVLDDGHFVSINPAMLPTERGRSVIALSPRNRVLVESDGPFARVAGTASRPINIAIVYGALAESWSMSLSQAVDQVASNFDQIMKRVKH